MSSATLQRSGSIPPPGIGLREIHGSVELAPHEGMVLRHRGGLQGWALHLVWVDRVTPHSPDSSTN